MSTTVESVASKFLDFVPELEGRGIVSNPDGLGGGASHLLDIKERLDRQLNLADQLHRVVNEPSAKNEVKQGAGVSMPGDGRSFNELMARESQRLEGLVPELKKLKVDNSNRDSSLAQGVSEAWNTFVQRLEGLVSSNKTGLRSLTA